MLDELHINNTDAIEMLQTDLNINQFSSYAFIILTGLMFLAIIQLYLKQRGTRIIIENAELPQQSQLAKATQSEINPDTPSSSKIKLNDIPYF